MNAVVLKALFNFGDLAFLPSESVTYGSCPESYVAAVRKCACSRVATVQNCGSGPEAG